MRERRERNEKDSVDQSSFHLGPFRRCPAEQPGKQQKDSSMQGMMQEMMKGEKTGEGGMGGMMRMMKMMEQCSVMMEQCCGTAGSGEKKEGQNK